MSDATPGAGLPSGATRATTVPPAVPTSPRPRVRAAAGERTLGQLVADASHDLSAIVRSEVALAKAELRADLKAAAVGGAMFAVAGVLAFLALILLLIAAAYGLVAAGLAPWLAFLVVAVVLLVVTGVLALVGKKQLGRAGPPKRTMRTSKETVETLKGIKPHTS
jgi:hypothetical protein